MANILSKEKQIMAISSLCEGSSIRSIERISGVNRNTIMSLGLRVGKACQALLDEKMRDLDCQTIQVDEIWGFIGKKQAQVTPQEEKQGLGDAWTFISLDADSKLIPNFYVGKRDIYSATAFMEDLSARLKNRVQLSSDGLRAYVEAVERGFGSNVDYGQIVKVYAGSEVETQRRYSPPKVLRSDKTVVFGKPDQKEISTSYIERQNLNFRMHCRRLTRLTNAFSKKLENFKAAIALYVSYHNFVKIHGSLRMTPAMAAGVSSNLWTVADLVERAS